MGPSFLMPAASYALLTIVDLKAYCPRSLALSNLTGKYDHDLLLLFREDEYD